ncbi:nucleoside deaminase [Allostreptomyces psammosilenae]|uniref:tRNA(Arg) A34 adenosine deaminase TadA n=1 Tax=Allostreptomyces psammosilenae TaxID=1892865 RepID=A0A853ABT2_9ACTN|nr:nucleoside deaminase [Allostreptomyces psammosilenae]NYI07832.1 tRNA(Arg) A34 adenosine deaminase TadA [Allostreptomyces psammosilenae]
MRTPAEPVTSMEAAESTDPTEAAQSLETTADDETTADAAPSALPALWRLPFELAWRAFRAGSRPVGAVLRGPDGAVVALGRNRSREAVAPPGQLAGSDIAHAEINVLAQLPGGRDYYDHRLYTTLEPCLLCSSALINAHVGGVVYASPDPVWKEVADLPRVGGIVARRWVPRSGPAPGPLAVLGALLMDLWNARHAPSTPGGCGYPTLAARCLRIEGLLEADCAETAYQLLLPSIRTALNGTHREAHQQAHRRA